MNASNNRQRQQGITLLEVLISILVLSFGLLGMLGLTANSLKISSTSYYRTIAAHQLTTMADMMVANPYLVAYAYYAPPSVISSPNTDCLGSSGCPQDVGEIGLKKADANGYNRMPDNEYFIWRSNVERLLPSGKGIVCLDETPDDGHQDDFKCSNSGRPTIKICWKESSRISTSIGGASGSETSADTCRVTQL